MHPPEAVNHVLALARAGLPTAEIVRRTGVARGTVKDWRAGRVPRGRPAGGCSGCGGPPHDLDALPEKYVYLLGLYLGDGYIAAHRRGVFKLRLCLDLKYPAIIAEASEAMRATMPRSRTNSLRRPTACAEVYSYSKTWPCLFPQHGAGRKHGRQIVLADWQERLVERSPQLLLRGLIHSDGCRFMNTGNGWRHPRYSFSNMSDDIRRIFCTACDLMGVHWTTAPPKTVYVSRKADVALLDTFIGPKR
jgi:hypothetical protein